MRRIRSMEDRCLELSSEGFFVGSVHTCHGHEAVAIGVTALKQPQDKILSTYRGHGWGLGCGVPLVELMGEICQRSGGINGGRSGSLMLTAPEYGFVGENSIVGAGAPIADGVALAAQITESGGVAVATIGDGAMSQGALHEGLVFAAVKNLPVVFICENNGWAEMTPASEMTRDPQLANRAAAYGLPSRSVDGCDLKAVLDASTWALDEARAGRGPVFLEFKVVRMKGHYNRDIEHYRPRADIEDAKSRDPLARLVRQLISDRTATAEELKAVDAAVQSEVDAATVAVRNMAEPIIADATTDIYAAEAIGHRGTNKGRGEPSGPMEYWRAINTALATDLSERQEMVVYGEDVAFAGGIFGVTRGLQKRFGTRRVFDTPIAETAILGSAVGASIAGLRPVVEIMWMDFLMVALDQLVNQAANVRYASRGTQSAPLTVRLQQGATAGSCAQHTQSLEALLAHIPGLRVGLPASPADAYAMTRAAIADADPVVLIESRELYQLKGVVYPDADIEAVRGSRLYPADENHVVVITWGAMVQRALAAKAQLRSEGIEIAVLDLRWLAPLDLEAVTAAVRHARGRAAVVHEANLTGGFGGEVVSRIHEGLGREMPLDIRRLATPDSRIPTPGKLQKAIIPGTDSIIEVCRELSETRPAPSELAALSTQTAG
ncbi:alpha-ketoacid dehydrogenase subunit alpha/beta [Rhodococcus sp. 114MFTsu3.1]|uniref:alpha-ketoacid dehydrogenase subunit alpha/beta n=1 Tax=Rhodococcus sp. 114MFTsu3.1 TaxID=1172184 RepID=UPI0006882E0B|nr:alpha-ketoacid dehydrogenase subunit alpha/beta [Rhodococcus sp. 114MFTsu3.1]